MILRIFINLLAIVVFVVITVLGAFEGIFSLRNVVDAGFIVSILVFFIGLISFTNATEVLRSTGFVLKKMFTPNTRKAYQKFYEYKEEKKEVREKTLGLPTLIAGTLVLIIDFILATMIMNNMI